jgi:hypothetical protein
MKQSRGRARHHPGGRDRSRNRSGEADIQDEVPNVQVQRSAASPVRDSAQDDDGKDDYHHPEQEHDYSGNCVPGD